MERVSASSWPAGSAGWSAGCQRQRQMKIDASFSRRRPRSLALFVVVSRPFLALSLAGKQLAVTFARRRLAEGCSPLGCKARDKKDALIWSTR